MTTAEAFIARVTVVRGWLLAMGLWACGGASPTKGVQAEHPSAAGGTGAAEEEVALAPRCTPKAEAANPFAENEFEIATTHLVSLLRDHFTHPEIRSTADFRAFIARTEWGMRFAYGGFENLGYQTEGRWEVAAHVRQGQVADLRLELIQLVKARGAIGPDSAYIGAPKYWTAERDVAWTFAQKAARKHCIDNAWSQWLSRRLERRSSRARVPTAPWGDAEGTGASLACSQDDPTMAFFDVPVRLLRPLEDEFSKTLQGMRIELAPETIFEAQSFITKLELASESLLDRLGVIERLFIGPRAAAALELQAAIYDNWADALADIPVPRVLLEVYDPTRGFDGLERWERRRDEAVKVKKEQAEKWRAAAEAWRQAQKPPRCLAEEAL